MSSDELTIRAASPGDDDGLISLWHRCHLLIWYNDPQRDLALFREGAASEIFVGVLDTAIVATVCVGADGHRGWLYYLAVQPECRGRGYARQLVRHAEAWLSERGVPKVQILIREDTALVRDLYVKLGYEPNPCAIMQRWLTDPGRPPDDPAERGGRMETTITYLEMTERPSLPFVVTPRDRKLALLRAVRPPLGFYRFLYDGVGGPWLWYERRLMGDEELQAIIHDERVEIYVLYVDGAPAGYAELDRRDAQDIELAYFGLMSEFIGRGLGVYLLTTVIDHAWSYNPRRLWVHTNTFDHPRALPLYQRCGFRPYKQEQDVIDDPRVTSSIHT